MMRTRRHILRSPRRQGAILVVAMFILLALTGLALVHARTMRVEGVVAANRQAAAQARCIAMGAAQAVLAMHLDTPTQAVEVNGGCFWIIKNNGDDDHTYYYGIVDEASKININSAPPECLELLPNMTAEIADAIVDWRDADDNVTDAGAESEYYMQLADPYEAKNENFETVEELSLVRDITALQLYGDDYNQNGVLDPNEDDGDDTFPPDNRDGKLDRGLVELCTVYSSEPTTGKVNLNSLSTAGSPPINGRGGSSGSTNGDADQQLRDILAQHIGGSSDQMVDRIIAGHRSPFRSTFDLVLNTTIGLTVDEFNQIEPYIYAGASSSSSSSGSKSGSSGSTRSSGSGKQTGLVNVNTAPKEVLAALPGLDESDAEALVAARGASTSTTTNSVGLKSGLGNFSLGASTSTAPKSTTGASSSTSSLSSGSLSSGSLTGSSSTDKSDPTMGTGQGLGWVLGVLSPEKAQLIGSMITVRSYQYSADIVAVSSDGRAFERYRMVYDVSGTAPKVLAWKRLTHLGWPLDVQILADLRSGKPVSELVTTTTVTNSDSAGGTGSTGAAKTGSTTGGFKLGGSSGSKF